MIESAAEGLADAYRQRLQKRIGELVNRGGGPTVELDAGRLAQEVARLIEATSAKSWCVCAVTSNNFARR